MFVYDAVTMMTNNKAGSYLLPSLLYLFLFLSLNIVTSSSSQLTAEEHRTWLCDGLRAALVIWRHVVIFAEEAYGP
jgi:hypothetical protein